MRNWTNWYFENARPQHSETGAFIRRLSPDIFVARCKVLLKESVFSIPAKGTSVMHPGICPEYRNAHGCFWARANRDLNKGLCEQVDTASSPEAIYSNLGETAAAAGIRVLFNSEPITAVHSVLGCSIVSRYNIAEGRRLAFLRTWVRFVPKRVQGVALLGF